MVVKSFAAKWLGVLVTFFGVALASSSQAQSSYLLAGADQGGIGNVQNFVQNSNVLNGTVTVFDAFSGTPTLTQLNTYDCVVVWSNNTFADPVTMGNNLADYVDGGGHVVLCAFANVNLGGGFSIEGRFATGGYLPIPIGGYNYGTLQNIGTVQQPNHPIMQGVTTANGGGQSYHITAQPASNATVICNQTNGYPLVALQTNVTGGVVGFNWYPGEIDPNTDADVLLANCMEWRNGSLLTVTAPAGTVQNVYADDQGPNNDGRIVGSFEIANGAVQAGILTEIEITHNGTADATTSISELKLYRDVNTDGMLDSGDVDLGVAPAFASAMGTTTISLTGTEQDFMVSEAKEYLIAVKLSGTAAPGETLSFEVSDLTAGQGTRGAGTPSTTMVGLEILAPGFTIADVSNTTTEQVYLGSTDVALMSFTIAYPNGPDSMITDLAVHFEGTGVDNTAFDRVALMVDADADGMLTSADTELATATIPQDNGDVTFTLTGMDATFSAGDTRQYWVAVDINFSPQNGETFGAQLVSATQSPTSTTLTGPPLPAMGVSAGIEILGNALVVTDQTTLPDAMIDAGSVGPLGDGEMLLEFTTFVTNATWGVSSFTFKASGTGDDSTAYAELQLFEDAGDGLFGGASAELAGGSLVAPIAADDGTFEFNLTDAVFLGQTERRFFLLGKFSNNVRAGLTYEVSLESTNSTPPNGGVLLGVPSAAGTEYTVNPASFDVTFNGPNMRASVNNNALGQLLYDVTISTRNEPFDVASLSFNATGTGDDSAAFTEIALYEDTDGSGFWEFANDTLATTNTAAGFDANDGNYVAMLSDTDFAGAADRRFFLIANLNGTALANQTFNVTLNDVSITAPTGVTATGVPAMEAGALIINTPVLSLAAALNTASARTLEAGSASTEVLGTFEFGASNGDATITAIKLTTSGTANWVDAVNASDGIELYLDSDSSATFDAGSDTLIASSPGINGAFTLMLSSPFTVLNGQMASIFVIAKVRAEIGANEEQSVHTLRVSIVSPSDVTMQNPGTTVLFGSRTPATEFLTVLEWSIDSFTPVRSVLLDGGADIVITGGGFVPNISLTIGGVRADGFASVNATGTMITGLRVPAALDGNTSNLEIILDTGALPPRTLGVVFNYGAAPSGGGGGGGCALADGSESPLILLLALCAAGSIWLTLRKRNA